MKYQLKSISSSQSPSSSSTSSVHCYFLFFVLLLFDCLFPSSPLFSSSTQSNQNRDRFRTFSSILIHTHRVSPIFTYIQHPPSQRSYQPPPPTPRHQLYSYSSRLSYYSQQNMNNPPPQPPSLLHVPSTLFHLNLIPIFFCHHTHLNLLLLPYPPLLPPPPSTFLAELSPLKSALAGSAGREVSIVQEHCHWLSEDTEDKPAG